MLHDRAELRWLHEAVNPTTASCWSWETSFVLSEVDDTSILRTGLPTPSQLPAQLVRIGDSLSSTLSEPRGPLRRISPLLARNCRLPRCSDFVRNRRVN
jgi:hypothetical protein